MKIIAEIGWNHMGDMNLAIDMIRAAKEAGATHAKFQTWHEKNLKPGPWDEDGRREIYKKAELSEKQFLNLKHFCDEVGIKFLTSVFSAEDVDSMASISNAEIKIPSPEIANYTLIDSVCEKFEKIYLSTGASTYEEVSKAVEMIGERGVDLVLMHCVSLYPCPDDKVNLGRLEKLRGLCEHVGLSDHTPDSLSAILSLPMGVVAIEKHFTIDQNLPGRDNKFALLPDEFSKIAIAWERYSGMTKDLGFDFQSYEEDVRDTYRGRWSQN